MDFVFDVRSAFMGRFRSILAMILDQSCVIMIAIDSRMLEDDEELKILL